MSRSSPTGARALIPNPALKPLEFLVGEWRTTSTHSMVPGERLSGRTSISWLEGGAFLIMRSQIDHPLFPDGLAIVASDDKQDRFALTWFDERGTSRLFDLTLGDRSLTWRRDDPEFALCTTLAAEGEDRLVATVRLSQNGGAWSDDAAQVYEREQGVAG